ncbi:MAG: hypothetical protein ACJ75B_03535 [Flavisolibacter sp.]
MRALFLFAFTILALSSPAQYYYKDIIGTNESSEIIRNYMKNKVSRVLLNSFDADNQKDNDFYVEQQFSEASGSLKTITRSDVSNESMLVSYVDQNGNVVRTVDSSGFVVSNTSYSYNTSGQLISMVSSSADTASTSEMEQHLWEWNNRKPVRMIRIKNRLDTTYIDFKLDEKGNVSEERETRKGVIAPPVYYYYNDNNQLTDIVRYSKRANRLLPEYMFEYSSTGQLIQKITVPANSSEYLIWRYQYNNQGLKTKEVIYNKQKKLTGKVEYQYFN